MAVACSAPPEGHARWTLRLLADQAVKLELTGSISRETVRQVLKKTNSSRGGIQHSRPCLTALTLSNQYGCVEMLEWGVGALHVKWNWLQARPVHTVNPGPVW